MCVCVCVCVKESERVSVLRDTITSEVEVVVCLVVVKYELRKSNLLSFYFHSYYSYPILSSFFHSKPIAHAMQKIQL